MIKMVYEQPEIMENVNVEYNIVNSTDLIAFELMGEKVDLAIVPINLVAKLYNKGIPYKLLSVNTHGNLYVVTTEDIHSWEDLKGREIYSFGQGLVPDLMFKYLATQNGLDPEADFNITYLSGTAEIAPTFLSGKATVMLMPEPVLSVVKSKDMSFDILLDLQNEYETVTGTSNGFPQAGLIVKSTLLEENPEFVKSFLKEVESSTAWVNENPELAGDYMEEMALGIPKAIIKEALPGLNIEYVSAENSQVDVDRLLNILLVENPDSIGGSIPDTEFYYNEEK
jgi:NitT/TauT family transport system substrate-binding protein